MTWLWSVLPSWMPSLLTPFWGYGLLAAGALTLIALYAPFHKVRTLAGLAAVAVVAALISYTVGYNHGSKFVYGQWAAAEKAAMELGADARSRGERDDSDGLRDPNDRYYQANPRNPVPAN